jgi:hypothetical protein
MCDVTLTRHTDTSHEHVTIVPLRVNTHVQRAVLLIVACMQQHKQV